MGALRGTPLLSTGDQPIGEQSRRDTFSGAQPLGCPEASLVGADVLGKLLIELRERLRSPRADQLRVVAPLAIPELLLDGRPIGPIGVGQPAAPERR